LINKGENWPDLIYSIERHKYFKGQIGFILFLAGIEEYFNQNSNCDWPENDDVIFKQNFQLCTDKSRRIFSDNGLNEFPEFIWERALLSIGDYLIEEGSNQSFLINVDRDISWKRLLKGDKDKNHREIIKVIFNNIDINDIVQSLISIKDNNQVNDWRKYFIDFPRLFGYLGTKRYIRKASRHGFVLFSKERMSADHRELFSNVFFLKYLENKVFAPFKECFYYPVGGDDENDRPCAVIDNWEYNNAKYAVNIYYYLEQSKYKFCFFNRDSGNYNDNLKLIIESRGFECVNDSYVLYLDEEKILTEIISLCDAFNSLK